MAALAAPGAYAATCTPTGFYKDSMNLTAAAIDPPGTYSSTLDATGCNIGVFYGPGASGAVDNADISGANYFGVLVAGDCGGGTCTTGATSVDVTNSSVHDIGENPFNGTQHGDAIAYYAFASGASATGTVSGDDVYKYQKGGIVALGPGAGASISGSTVTGLGPVAFIAQNGIEIDYGATGQVMRNTVTGNSYSGTNNASTGILLFGGCGYSLVTGVQIVKNTLGGTTPADGNDIGIASVNLDPTCLLVPSTSTNVKIINNTITNGEKTNAIPYQAGISDCGVNDKLIHNDISGIGYDPASGPGYLSIDTSGCTTAAKVHANTVP
jgi:hypothetical protein